QRPNARQKEVLPSAHRDEALELCDATADGRGRYRERVCILVVGPRQGIALVVKAAELGVVDPGLLHELELSPDVGVGANEHETAIDTVVVVDEPRRSDVLTIRPTAAQNAMAVDDLRRGRWVRLQRVTRIRATYVRSDGAARPFWVLDRVSEPVLFA